MSRACGVELQVCLVHYKSVDIPMVERLKSAVEQAIIATGPKKAASSSSVSSRESEKATRMPSYHARM